MSLDFIFRSRLRIQPPPGASLFFKWILIRVPELVIGGQEKENTIERMNENLFEHTM